MIDLGTQQISVFAQPLGCDFARSVVDGLRSRLSGSRPHSMANVTLIVNTNRMARRIKSLFQEGPPGFLPKTLLLDHIDTLLNNPQFPAARASLRRRLELSQLIAPVLENHPELASKSSLFAVVDSLATLMDEMQGESVSIDAIRSLDVSDQSGHWQNAQTLIGIAYDYVNTLENGLDREERQARVVDHLVRQWNAAPPKNPIILVGSTGSRGTTAKLMRALAAMPNGAVLLPGFDMDLPLAIWEHLKDPLKSEDHPQYRFAKLLLDLGLDAEDVQLWHDTPVASQDRNRVISLSMRPAPVTDSWLSEGPELPDLPDALKDITLLEAPTQRDEALAIAIRLRHAVEIGQTAALITPDRMLGRQVTAALDRWDIIPDDSGGIPLHLTAPGRFLRHTAELFYRPLDAELLLTLLKHPLTQSGGTLLQHGLFTQQFELALRKKGVAFPDAKTFEALTSVMSEKTPETKSLTAWGNWLVNTFCDKQTPEKYGLDTWLQRHRHISELIAGGSLDNSGGLWEKAAGRAALNVISELEENAEYSGPLEARDYANLVHELLKQSEVRDRDEPRPDIMIWGTLEARVQGAELVVLGGLNDGIWPEAITADSWLNRSMRHAAGLLLPDRKIGLSAHDYQQAIASKEVWITRAIRSDESETVAARWVNRLVNLVTGLPQKRGPVALEEMRERGASWLARAEALENTNPITGAKRAAPKPPVKARPRDFSVTEIKTLVRDPYAIYAKYCLKLRKLDPLVPEPDAAMRGIVIHDVMETFIRSVANDHANLSADHLLDIANGILADTIPWPIARTIWRSRLVRISDWLVDGERKRLAKGRPIALEKTAQGRLELPEIGGLIRARADRIDLDSNGSALLYDYKSGDPPTQVQQATIDKQLLLEAAMIEEGAFHHLGPKPVISAHYIGLGTNPKLVPVSVQDLNTPQTLADLKTLISSYLEPNQHYLSRRMPHVTRFEGDYDHLARHGEWDDSDPPSPEVLS